MKLTLEQNTCCLSHTGNLLPADALVILGVRASAGMVIDPIVAFMLMLITIVYDA